MSLLSRARLLVVLALAPALPAHADPPSLAGTWAFAQQPTELEPKARVVELGPRCWGPWASMTVKQDGAHVSIHLDWYPAQGGAMRRYWTATSEDAAGDLEGNHLILTGEHVIATVGRAPDFPSANGKSLPAAIRTPVRYDLVLNARGHLVGTVSRNGEKPQPFWAAPSRPSREKRDCGAPPP